MSSSAIKSLAADPRETERRAFLAENGLGGALRDPLPMDASTRRYERLALGGRSLIFMDAPPVAESQPCPPDASPETRKAMGWNAIARLAASRVDAFVAVAGHLEALGLSAPHVFAHDTDRGFALLEDLGGRVYAREIEKGADETGYYTVASEALARVHRAERPGRLERDGASWPILTYDALAFQAGADLFREWYPRHETRLVFTDAQTARWEALISDYAARLEVLPQVLLLRDYHAENLIWLPDRKGPARTGILDFQDAIAGPAAWDIAMFLQDARRDISPAAYDAALSTWLDATGTDETPFAGELAVAGALNALRILGLFARLIHRDEKPRYGAFIPREMAHLKTNLTHPDLQDLRGLLEDAFKGPLS